MPNANNGQVCYQGALDSKTNPVRRTFESLEEKNSHASEPSDTDGHRLCRTASVVEDPETAVKMIGYYPDTSPLLKPLPTSSHPERLRYKSFDGDDIDVSTFRMLISKLYSAHSNHIVVSYLVKYGV
eukprot:1184664-Amorphochlora_amoeboformis.AAC.1